VTDTQCRRPGIPWYGPDEFTGPKNLTPRARCGCGRPAVGRSWDACARRAGSGPWRWCSATSSALGSWSWTPPPSAVRRNQAPITSSNVARRSAASQSIAPRPAKRSSSLRSWRSVLACRPAEGLSAPPSKPGVGGPARDRTRSRPPRAMRVGREPPGSRTRHSDDIPSPLSLKARIDDEEIEINLVVGGRRATRPPLHR